MLSCFSAAVVCVCLLNRLLGDQVRLEPAELERLEWLPFQLISRFMALKLGLAK